MKKTLKLTTMLLGFALIFGTSCKKYEEGPALSLRSKKARVANTWVIDKATSGSVDITSLFEGDVYTYEKDGTYTNKYNGGTETKGTWEFGNNKETIKTTTEGSNLTSEATIIKLKNNEMWTKETVAGTVVEIHLKSK